MDFVGRGRWNRTIRAAVFSWLAGLLLIASPGGAFAQTVTQDQYSAAGDQYSDGGAQQAPVGPEDPAYPRLTTPAPSSAPPGDAPDQSSAAAQDQYSGGGATGTSPSSVPPAGPPVGPSRAPEAAPEDPSSPGPASPEPQGAGPSQVPVGPGDPAHPGLVPQAQQNLGQTLNDVSADLGGIGQSLATLGQGTAPADAQTPTAAPAFSAPTTAVVGGASPGQPPVAAVDPYSAATNAVSAVGAGAPGYTTTASDQAPQGVAVLGGLPQDQQAPVAVVDPYSTAVGAVSPSVPGETVQVAQYLQQLLYTQQTADYLAQLLAAAAPPAGQIGLADIPSTTGLDPDIAITRAMDANPESANAMLMHYATGIRDVCSLQHMTPLWSTPDSMSDPNTTGDDRADMREVCGPSTVTSNPMLP